MLNTIYVLVVETTGAVQVIKKFFDTPAEAAAYAESQNFLTASIVSLTR